MASPLAELGGLRQLEDALNLLRRTPLTAYVWYMAGNLPLAAGSVFFLMDATGGRLSGARLAIDAAAMVLLLAWMNCSRAVFAAHLRSEWSGQPLKPWTFAAAWRLLLSQTMLSSAKLGCYRPRRPAFYLWASPLLSIEVLRPSRRHAILMCSPYSRRPFASHGSSNAAIGPCWPC